jgi:tetratricopeptide (TPR) repeat protein
LKRILVVGVVLGLALALFLVGSLLPLRVRTSPGKPADSPQPASFMAPASGQQGLDNMITLLQRRLTAQRNDWSSLAQLGLAYYSKGRLTANPAYYAKSASAFHRSLRLNSAHNFQAFLGMGILAGARHRFKSELSWGRKAMRLNPYNADARGVIADGLIELARYPEAKRALQHMVDLRPGAAAYARISYFRELNGDVPGAIAAMKMALQASTGDDAAYAAYHVGDLYLAVGRFKKARFFFRQAGFLAPGYVLSRAGFAKLAAATGHYGKAIRLLTAVVRRYPLPVYVSMLGDLYQATGNSAQATKQYRLFQAEQKLFEANKVEPDAEVVLLSADHHVQVEKALRLGQREFAERPSPRVCDAYAWALYAKGRYNRAHRVENQALRLGTHNALYYYHAGLIASAMHRQPRARRYLAEAKRLYPRFSYWNRRATLVQRAVLEAQAS